MSREKDIGSAYQYVPRQRPSELNRSMHDEKIGQICTLPFEEGYE